MMIIIGWCTVYVSSAVIIFICLCAKKRKEAGRALEMLEVWGWVGWQVPRGCCVPRLGHCCMWNHGAPALPRAVLV